MFVHTLYFFNRPESEVGFCKKGKKDKAIPVTGCGGP
jgi:hypothetical protein